MLGVLLAVATPIAAAPVTAAHAAPKPSIGAIKLDSRDVFGAVHAVLRRTTSAVVCVEDRCAELYRSSQPLLWTTPANQLPVMRHGDRHRVTIVASNRDGQLAWATRRVIVK